MSVKIVESLENLIKMTPELQSVIILDRDGVPIVNAGEEVRNRSQYSASYLSSIEQAKKLGMGEQKFWVFQYEAHQLVLLNFSQFAVFLIGTSSANTGILCSLEPQLRPILNDCVQIVRDIIGTGTPSTIA